MLYLNTHEIATYAVNSDPERLPNLHRAADTLANLAQWADENSDGWAYWPKPCRAAASLQRLLIRPEHNGYDAVDCDAATLAAALRPVKAFLTRQGVDHDAIISA